eukprot:CAMPEP_0170336402 /NCGR_PEP_ID=MMETSP0116_2-20130129/69244_2 /TAXON_ID=400756 /ORGANISM="Durinskia baltica, Strain CSIRO CS-38" /LENGTH=45 /DNA_ID= /DNA_START= /DNA_END= /DNA_ORIENTATION=
MIKPILFCSDKVPTSAAAFFSASCQRHWTAPASTGLMSCQIFDRI